MKPQQVITPLDRLAGSEKHRNIRSEYAFEYLKKESQNAYEGLVLSMRPSGAVASPKQSLSDINKQRYN